VYLPTFRLLNATIEASIKALAAESGAERRIIRERF